MAAPGADAVRANGAGTEPEPPAAALPAAAAAAEPMGRGGAGARTGVSRGENSGSLLRGTCTGGGAALRSSSESEDDSAVRVTARWTMGAAAVDLISTARALRSKLRRVAA